jgi:diguanylate cyclase (GGDEF)-like protein
MGIILRSLILILTWLALWRASVLMEYAPYASIWFPPAALTLAAFLMLGARAWPAMVVALAIATYWVGPLYGEPLSAREWWWSSVFFVLTHGGTYYLAAMAIQRVLRGHQTARLPTTLALILCISVVASFVAALTGALSLGLTRLMSWSEAYAAIGPWWAGDMAAVIILTPLFIGLMYWQYPQLANALGALSFQFNQSRKWVFVGKLCVLQAGLAAVVVLTLHSDMSWTVLLILALLVPQLWIVFTESAFRIALSLGGLSFALVLWVNGLGLAEDALQLQLGVLVIAFGSWLGTLIPVLMADNRTLQQRENIDELTGVASRGAFMERAHQLLERRHPSQSTSSLLLFDIDHFKQVNDQHGHVKGDQALQLVAQTVADSLRDSDLLGRFGGDEFMLLLYHTNQQQSMELAARLQHALAQRSQNVLGFPLSLSFGVVEVDHEEAFMQAFKRADNALFNAKRGGRARAAAL